MENIRYCPLCGSGEKPLEFLSCPDFLTGSGHYSMVQCKNCELVYTNPRPYEKNLGEFYKSNDYISHTEQKRTLKEKAYFAVQSYMLKQKAKMLKRLPAKGKQLLDVGCGAGAFAKKMQGNGYQVIGVEPQAAAREKARQKGVQVFDNQEEILKTAENSFQYITLWHVLEHHARFMESLKLYYRLLTPGGYLVVAVPQYESYDAFFYRQFWAAYDLPRHLVHFSEATLKFAAQRNGFRLVNKKGMPFDAFYVALLSEKYKGARLGTLRAMLVGAWSNFHAFMKGRPWSSQIFVFQKK